MVALSTLAFGLAVLLAGPDLSAPLVARAAHGAEITAESQAQPLAAAPARVHAGADLRVDEFYVHIPAGAQEPLTVLLALHGVGGGGEDFVRPLLPLTDAAHWVVVAPTYIYGDWRDPAQLTREATTQLPNIAALLDRLPEIAGLPVQRGALVYGFSRGGQSANRFALAYPDHVAGVVLLSCGTYTLPFASLRSSEGDMALPFPYGIANFAELFGYSFDARRFGSIPFMVAVGGRDSDPADVPHQWDRYIGSDRVERAQRFAGLLREAGMDAQARIFSDVGHGETDQTRAAAVDFLKGTIPS